MRVEKLKRFFSFALALLLLAGCMEPVELAKMGIVVGMGIDKFQGGYLVTLQIVNPAGVTGSNPNILPVYSMHVGGQTLLQATNDLANLATQVLYYSHLKVVVIDEDIVKDDGIDDIIDFLMRHPETRPDVTVLITEDTTASDVLNVVTAVETIPMGKLDTLTNINRQRTGMIASLNLYEVMDRLHTDGTNLVLNMVSLRAEEEHLPHAEQDQKNEEHQKSVEEQEYKLWPSQEEDNGEIPEGAYTAENMEGLSNSEAKFTPGSEGPTKQNKEEITPPMDIKIENLAVFRDNKMVGKINSLEAQSYNLLLGSKKRYWGHVDIGDEYFASLLITDAKATTQCFLKEGKASIDLKVRGELLEGNYPINVENPHNLKELEEKFVKDIETKTGAFIKKTQEELKSDISDIGIAAYFSDYKEWEKVSANWSEIYPTLDIKINVEVDIYSTGEIKNYHNLR
ncbi:MAG: Ger(x)C family spore germination protein [Turicibacter sp.]|nr:Ger(x)C family spore germination protein [Turicibacter sp.]